MTSPSGMFYASNARNMLSPPLSSSHSPRLPETLQRSSPGITPELLSKSTFHQLEKLSVNNTSATEHARSLLEHSRSELHRTVSDHQRSLSEHPDISRKNPMSPHEAALHAMQMQSFARAHELDKDRMMEYHARFQTPSHRTELRGESMSRNELPPRSMYEHRGEEGDQARLIASRERYLHQNAAALYRGTSPPHSTSQQTGHHSTNLVLGRADGAIIGPLSSYENRPSSYENRQSPYENRQSEHKR